MAARDFRQFLRRELVEKQGCTVLLATHNADEALNLCDRVSVLHKGKLLAVGTVDELIAKAGHNKYQLLARDELRPCLDEFSSSSKISDVSTDSTSGDGWTRFEFKIPGGRDKASELLERIVATGIPVAVFERKDLALADLLERILSGADDE